MSLNFSPHSRSRRTFGFTLVEMLVVIGIFSIMTAVALANLPAFRSQVTLDLVAQEVALAVRQAQVFTTGTRGLPTNYSFPSYGIYLDIRPSGASVFGDNAHIRFGLFPLVAGADVAAAAITTNSYSETFLINGPVTIDSLEATGDAGCTSNPTYQLAIVFDRPYHEPRFYPNLASGSCTSAGIILASTRDVSIKRKIVVHASGQIEVVGIPN